MQTEPDWLTRLGGWLFRHRTSIPLPVAAAILTLRIGQSPPSTWLVGAGILVTLAGEALRLWGVHHIGAISRTRSDRLGPLIDTGPFAVVRNPLYIGNIALWVGFAVAARLLWLAAAIVVILALEYHAIVRWEERLLVERRGEEYRDYCTRVPRWWPSFNRRERGPRRERDVAVSTIHALRPTWRETLFSERGTFVAMASGYLLLYLKARF